jgi:hypothetical protein
MPKIKYYRIGGLNKQVFGISPSPRPYVWLGDGKTPGGGQCIGWLEYRHLKLLLRKWKEAGGRKP